MIDIAKSKCLSKTSFVAGRTCHRKLWQLLWDRHNAGPRSGIDQLRMEFGIRFGKVAHCLYPNAVVIDIDARNLDKAAEDTRRAIEAGANVICEATFRHERCRALSDIVIRQSDDSWHLIEVKSSTHVKPEHYPDLAFQKWVMKRCGYPVSKCSVVFANKSGTWPDKPSIFQFEDVTDQVDVALRAVPRELGLMLPIAGSRGEPPNAKEWYSKECHECEFKKTICWKGIEEPTIYDVVNACKLEALEAMGILYVRDIPQDFELSSMDRRHVDRINAKAIDIDEAGIQSMLDELEYPIHFLDFESIAVVVPLFDGNRPWEKLPFQYSVHILEQDGTMRHAEYLHERTSDPSLSVAERLVEDIGSKGSVVVYHAQMESGVLNYLAKRFPQYAERLNSMNARIWDLEIIFLKHYRHWKFGSKSSIKVVLPTLIPELSYETEEVSDGGDASLTWIKMHEADDMIERQQRADALRSYCKLDTIAMKKLLGHVSRLSARDSERSSQLAAFVSR